jgi:hypothetical protein
LKIFSSSRRPVHFSPVTVSVAVIAILVWFHPQAATQGDSISKIDISRIARPDSLSAQSAGSHQDSLSKKTAPIADSLSKKADAAQGDSLLKKGITAQNDTLSKKRSIDFSGLSNIVLTQKNIRAYGWGEYKVGGRCLCCDNLLDGDCIVIHTTNRTEKERINQIVDGKTAADTNDKSTYFGDIVERERSEPVSLLMAEISIKKRMDVYKVLVYTMVDKEKKKNYLSNCELGYYDQFDRLQWVGKAESKWFDDSIAFEMEKPVFTKSLLLKVRSGKNRITEVAIFGKNDTQ